MFSLYTATSIQILVNNELFHQSIFYLRNSVSSVQLLFQKRYLHFSPGGKFRGGMSGGNVLDPLPCLCVCLLIWYVCCSLRGRIYPCFFRLSVSISVAADVYPAVCLTCPCMCLYMRVYLSRRVFTCLCCCHCSLFCCVCATIHRRRRRL